MLKSTGKKILTQVGNKKRRFNSPVIGKSEAVWYTFFNSMDVFSKDSTVLGQLKEEGGEKKEKNL